MNKTKIAFALLLFSTASFGQRQYTVTALESPTSDNNGVAWISDDGSTTFGGLSQSHGTTVVAQCYSLSNGQLTTYPTPGLSCGVIGVNQSLQFTGVIETPLGASGSNIEIAAYVNSNGTFDVFGSNLPGFFSQGVGINNQGVVVGNLFAGITETSFTYANGTVTYLPSGFNAVKINDNGDVAGATTSSTSICNSTTCQASIYRNGSLIGLGSPGSGPSYANGINSSDQVIGVGASAPFNPADLSTLIPIPYFYDGKAMQTIDVPNSAYGASPTVINDSGEVAGTYWPDNKDYCSAANGVWTCSITRRAFYYANGVATDLTNLIVNAPSGLVIRDIIYMNKAGQILAASPNSDESWSPTYLLTPVAGSSPGVGGLSNVISATPNPAVGDANGLATVTLNWNVTNPSVTAVELHVGSPGGPLFSAGSAAGSATTGEWVSNGAVFYLQNVSGGLPLAAANTLGTVTVTVK